jgi:uncharacterized membrane protein
MVLAQAQGLSACPLGSKIIATNRPQSGVRIVPDPHPVTITPPGLGFRPTRRECQSCAVFLVFFLALAIRAASERSLWFDEISTITIASRPTLHDVLQAIPSDGNPPLYFLLVRCSLALTLRTELAVRLPSIVSWLLGAVLVYLFVRRNANSWFAFAAFCLFLGGTMEGNEAIEARPYSLLLFCTLLAICAWQSVAFRKCGWLAPAVLALATAGAILTHQYGVVYIAVPVFSGELVRSWRDRKLHLSLIGSMMFVWPLLVLTVPSTLKAQAPLLQAIESSPSFAYRPVPRYLTFYADTLPVFVPTLLLLCLVGAGIVWNHQRDYLKPERNNEVKEEDIWVALSLVLIIPIMLVVTALGTRYFVPRYGCGASIGVATSIPLLLSSFSRYRKITEYLARVAIVYSLIVGFLGFWIARPRQPLGGVQSEGLFRDSLHDEDIVFGDALTYVPTWWYSNSAERPRLHYLTDLSYTLRCKDPVPENSLALEQPYGAPPIVDYTGFTKTHKDFLLLCNTGKSRYGWIRPRLLNEGWKLRLVRKDGDLALFRATAPEGAGKQVLGNPEVPQS